MKKTLIKNAIIVNEDKSLKGYVIIENDIIKDIVYREEKIEENDFDEIIDADGNYLMPGVIDDHVHFRDPGLTHKADMNSESKAAVAGGVTSFMDMPNTSPQTTTIEALENKFGDAATKSLINYSFYFGATNSNISLLPSLDRKNICGIKLFMGASTGNMLVDRMDLLAAVFKNANMIVATHCEEQSIISKNTSLFREKFGEDLDIKYHPLIRSEEACYHSSQLAVKLATEADARLHILHISTKKELSLLSDKPINEKMITAEVCIPHLMFCDEDYAIEGSRIKCNPAIKGIDDREALRTALSTDIIDVIGTDHAPHLLKEKEGGALKAVSGMPMIQFSLISMMELYHKGYISITQLVRKMCHNPADLYNIEKRGYIRKGYKADLVIVNPNFSHIINNGDILSKCGWSPMEGHTFRSKVEKTFVNGTLVYSDNRINENYRGEALTFTR